MLALSCRGLKPSLLSLGYPFLLPSCFLNLSVCLFLTFFILYEVRARTFEVAVPDRLSCRRSKPSFGTGILMLSFFNIYVQYRYN